MLKNNFFFLTLVAILLFAIQFGFSPALKVVLFCDALLIIINAIYKLGRILNHGNKKQEN